MAPSLAGHMASEDRSVEQPALELLEELGWRRINLLGEQPGPSNPTGRTSLRQTYLPAHLRAALAKLNPRLSPEPLALAEDRLVEDRSAMLPMAANQALLRLLVDGVAVEVRRDDGSFETVSVRVIDWIEATSNDFLVASQVWIEGPLHKRRPDTIGFVNGLPLMLAEWKGITQPLAEAYDANLCDYRDTIPRLFDANGFVILSNGLEAVMGASHAPFEFFAPWKRLEEGGPESVGLEMLLREPASRVGSSI